MSDNSKIEWTDATYNPVRGCVKVSAGCKHCYAETFAERFRGVKDHPYEQGFDLRLVPDKLAEPLSWKKPRRVFVNSMSDLFQDGVPDSYIDQVFAVMALCPQHTFQVLTKRADRMLKYMTERPDGTRRVHHVGHQIVKMDPSKEYVYHTMVYGLSLKEHEPRKPCWPLPNVWLGCSVENQHFADERIPLLLQTPAGVRFISAEPLLGPVDLFAFLKTDVRDDCIAILNRNRIDRNDRSHPGLDWVIVGGESGPGARPFDVAWARSLVAQCKAAGVACFVKQLGANAQGWDAWPTGEALTLRSKKGGDPAEWPSDLRVREFPTVSA